MPCPPPGDLPDPVMEPRSPKSQADSLPSELPGKPKNTAVGSVSLLQGKFLTQEFNQGVLHCRQTLYQLSHLSTARKTQYSQKEQFFFFFKKRVEFIPNTANRWQHPYHRLKPRFKATYTLWDGGAWWAAVYGVAQSRTRLKRLSSSSSSTLST